MRISITPSYEAYCGRDQIWTSFVYRMSGADDPVVLDWAANEGRILLTHDVATITLYAYTRVAAGQHMPGVFEVNRNTLIGPSIVDILLVAECSLHNEWEGRILYLPLS
jgi:hypothetical protein